MNLAGKLYTPEVLGLGARLFDYPMRADLPFLGQARSASCGSTLSLALACDGQGRITQLGLRAQACAIGQAAAALFAEGIKGHDRASLVRAEHEICHWLGNGGPLPVWPGLEVLAAAREYPARHGAILLAWRAALAALSNPADES